MSQESLTGFAVYFCDLQSRFDALYCKVPTLAIGRKVALRLNRELIERAGGETRGLPLYYASRTEQVEDDDEE